MPGPKQQLRIKLRQSPGSDPNTPGARSSATPTYRIDNDALLRQQRHVLEGMNGGRSSRQSPSSKVGTPAASSNPFSGTRGSSATVAPLSSAQTRTAGSPPAVNGVKQDVQSPALSAIRPASTASDAQRLSVPAQNTLPTMAPPHAISRPASGSPHPNGVAQQPGYVAPYQPPTYYAPPAAPRVDCFRKAPLKSMSPLHLIQKLLLTKR